MAEARQTILERVALYIMELRGAEEVEKGIEAVDIRFTKIAQSMEADRKLLVQLGRAFKDVGRSLRPLNMEGINAVKFLEQYAIAAEKAWEVGDDLSHVMYAQSEEGQRVAESFGLIKPIVEKTTTAFGRLKEKFWDLNVTARALLRVFVAFKILTGLLGVFQDIARATAELQMEMWRLRATVTGVSESIEGGIGSWEDWVDMVSRLRKELPFISTKEIAEGLRQITAIVGPLGLTTDQLEELTGLIGRMSLVVGQDFLPYMRLIITAVTGTGRAVATLGIDLRDGSVGLIEYAEAAGFVWEELNAQQKIYIRLGYAVDEMGKRTELVAVAMGTEWEQLKELRAAREDIRAQAPGLIGLQVEWHKVLLEADKILVSLGQKVTEYADRIIDFLNRAGAAISSFAIAIRRALAFPAGEVPFTEIYSEEYNRRMKEHYDTQIRKARQAAGAVTVYGQRVKDAAEDTDELEDSLLGLAAAAADAEDTLEEFGDALSRALRQARNALRSYQRAVEQAGIQIGRRLADIARNLEERLADLESRFEARRDQLIRRFEERRADLREEGAEKEEELRADLNKRLRRMEEDHLLDMQELREDYLIDLQEAARKRDAVSMRRIQQRYILEKKQRGRDYGVRRRRAIEDYKEQITELKKAREEQERELEKSLERQLRELQENYERQQEEARLNAERQREDAARNYQEQLDDLWRNFQDRLDAIIVNLVEEEEEWEDAYGNLRSFFDEWYRDDLTIFANWLNDRLRMLEEAGLIDPVPPVVPRDPSGPGWTEFAQGGMGIARGPTPIIVGEERPEMFAVWPLGQRMPRAGVDVRLTVDGTQAGAWSGDFENQTLRILREVLEEAL